MNGLNPSNGSRVLNNGACVPLTGKEVPKIGANEGGGDGEVAPPDIKADVMGTILA